MLFIKDILFRYLTSLKSSITNVFCHFYAKIKVDFYDSLPIENQFLMKSKNAVIIIHS